MPEMRGSPETPLVCVVDDDAAIRDALDSLLRSVGYRVRLFGSPEDFIACDNVDKAACLILDVQLGHVNGLDFQQELASGDARIPVVLISGHGDIPMTVRGMRAGAVTWLPKPFSDTEILAAVDEAVQRHLVQREQQEASTGLRSLYQSLTARERDVMGLVTAGLMNKQIAGRLQLSEITVKIHRGNLMRKMQAQSLADLVRMAESLGVRAMTSRYGK